VILGTVGDIADRVEAERINRSAMIIIGNVLAPHNSRGLIYMGELAIIAFSRNINVAKKLKDLPVEI